MRIFKTKKAEPAPTNGTRQDVCYGACRLCGRRRLLLKSTRTCIREVRKIEGYRKGQPIYSTTEFTLVPDSYCLRASNRRDKTKSKPRRNTRKKVAK